ncbi:Hsp20/alpha crystallin family protein [Fulvivirgaceae bacterium BMA10]|uniref:Hsp20/alpha crystallin family protein n=1 Tax=Splendidivirga corallicola TaxID=3051826 RepID=A0ABT8KX99_9BACT|nr:Hsp20/alpha crystallin family protein [Fulvivirgaceae bacterium BMA10]
MKKHRTHQSVFSRIGDTYGHFIDHDHFLGRSSLDGPWLVSRKTPTNFKIVDDDYCIELWMPGFKKDKIDITVKGDMIHVEANNGTEGEMQEREYNEAYIRSEFSVGHIERRFHLPKGIDLDKISASYREGILTIRFPVTNQETEKHIEVR